MREENPIMPDRYQPSHPTSSDHFDSVTAGEAQPSTQPIKYSNHPIISNIPLHDPIDTQSSCLGLLGLGQPYLRHNTQALPYPQDRANQQNSAGTFVSNPSGGSLVQQVHEQINVPVPVHELRELSVALEAIDRLAQMADPISLLSSVIAISGAGIEISKQLLSFAAAWRGCGEEIVYLGHDLQAFSTVLIDVHEWLSDNQAVISVRALENANEILQHCQQIFKTIRKMIGPFDKPDPRTFWPRLKWKFDRERVAPLRARLEGFKSTLTLLLSTMKLAKVKVEQKVSRSKLVLRPKAKTLRVQVEANIRANTIALGHLHFLEDNMAQSAKTQKKLTYSQPSEGQWLERLMPFFERPSLMPYLSHPILLGTSNNPGNAPHSSQELEKQKMDKAVGVLLEEWTTLNANYEHPVKPENGHRPSKPTELSNETFPTASTVNTEDLDGSDHGEDLLDSGALNREFTDEQAIASPTITSPTHSSMPDKSANTTTKQYDISKNHSRSSPDSDNRVKNTLPRPNGSTLNPLTDNVKDDPELKRPSYEYEVPSSPNPTPKRSASPDSEDDMDDFLTKYAWQMYPPPPPPPFGLFDSSNAVDWTNAQASTQYDSAAPWPRIAAAAPYLSYGVQTASYQTPQNYSYNSNQMPYYHQSQALNQNAGVLPHNPSLSGDSSANSSFPAAMPSTRAYNTPAYNSLSDSKQGANFSIRNNTDVIEGQHSLARTEYLRALDRVEQSRRSFIGPGRQAHHRDGQSIKVNTLSDISEEKPKVHIAKSQPNDVMDEVKDSPDEDDDTTDIFDSFTAEEDGDDSNPKLREWKRHVWRRAEEYGMRAEMLATGQAEAWAEEVREATAKREAEMFEQIRSQVELKFSERDRALREAQEREAVIYFTDKHDEKFSFPFLRARSWPEMLKFVREANHWPNDVVENTKIRIYDAGNHQILPDLWECLVKPGATYSSALKLVANNVIDKDRKPAESSALDVEPEDRQQSNGEAGYGSQENLDKSHAASAHRSQESQKSLNKDAAGKSSHLHSLPLPRIPVISDMHDEIVLDGDTTSAGGEDFAASTAYARTPLSDSSKLDTIWHQFFRDLEPQLQQAIDLEHDHAIVRTKRRLAKLLFDRSTSEHDAVSGTNQHFRTPGFPSAENDGLSRLSPAASRKDYVSGSSTQVSGQDASASTDPTHKGSLSESTPSKSALERYHATRSSYPTLRDTQYTVDEYPSNLTKENSTPSTPTRTNTAIQQRIEYITDLLRRKEALEAATLTLADERKLKMLEEQLLASSYTPQTTSSDTRPSMGSASLLQPETNSQSSSKRGKSTKLKSLGRMLVGRPLSTNDT